MKPRCYFFSLPPPPPGKAPSMLPVENICFKNVSLKWMCIGEYGRCQHCTYICICVLHADITKWGHNKQAVMWNTADVSNAKQDVPVHGNCTYIVKMKVKVEFCSVFKGRSTQVWKMKELANYQLRKVIKISSVGTFANTQRHMRRVYRYLRWLFKIYM